MSSVAKITHLLNFGSIDLINSLFPDLKKPFFWQTPLKLYVVQHEYKSKRIRSYTDFGKISVVKFLDEVESKEQESGVAPNFVHSLDSTHLFMTILKCYNDYKIDSFITVHDSFATHANDVENLSKALKWMVTGIVILLILVALSTIK